MSEPTTLFRFARVSRPAIHDLGERARQRNDLRDILDAPAREKRVWASRTLKGWQGIRSLSADYVALTGHDPSADPYMPGAKDLPAEAREIVAGLGGSEDYKADVDKTLTVAVAMKILGDERAVATGRLHQFLERLPDLVGSARRQRYAPAVLARHVPPARPKKPLAPPKADEQDADSQGTNVGSSLAEDIRLLWRLGLREKKARVEEMLRTAREERPRPASARQLPQVKGAVARRKREARIAESAEHLRDLRRHSEERARQLRDLRTLVEDTSIYSVLTMEPAALARHWGGMTAAQVKAKQQTVAAAPELDPAKMLSFCQAYEAAVVAADAGGSIKKQLFGIGNCFGETPQMNFGDDIRLAGIADLIRVEERFIKYSEAEISYVENILAGEHRVREVKSTREFELMESSATQEITVTESDTRATATRNLSTETAQELNSRFNTDVSASASASGGGSIGVVSFEGEGSLDAGVGVGIDASHRSETRSELGTEIVERSVERITRAAQASRISRTRSLYETLNRHEIDNTSGSPQHRRGIYCFLNKHVCISETSHGKRWFLKATAAWPGRNLICDRLTRIGLALADVDRPPEFTLSPADINPSNYLDLAGLYKAQGLAPPPPPTRRLGRSYKTDQTNESAGGPEGLEKIGKALMPVMKAYKRHLITDILPIPDGYSVQEVRVAINHGANGVSVPVDMPMKLAAAGMMAMPMALSYGLLFMPAALWNVLLLASPLMHHNTDSSSVTATVGVESRESHYYFFDADFLVSELLQLFGTFSAMAPALMAQIEQMAANLPAELNDQATAMANAVNASVDTIVTEVDRVFNQIKTYLEGLDLANLDLGAIVSTLVTFLTGFGTTVGTMLSTVPSTLFDPLSTFVQNVVTLISDAAESAMSDLMAALLASSENNQTLAYGESFGLTGELPVTLNVATVNPGVTFSLVACLARTDEALDQWRLEAFSALHQSYLQLVAEYEGKRFLATRPANGKSPGTMREEERRALREIIIHALNGVQNPPDPQTEYSFDRINLFEHAVDWNNMSYRLYNYGPSRREIALDRRGVFHGADPRRHAFLTAHWAEVMLPLSEVPALEEAMLAYFDTGATEIGSGLSDDELAALWRDVIAQRSLLAEAPEPLDSREIVLPTDLVVLRTDDSLPHDDTTPCTA